MGRTHSPRRLASRPRPNRAATPLPALAAFVRDALRSHLTGPYADELRQAQRDVILSRVVTLVWVASFMIPFAIFLWVGLTFPARLGSVFLVVAIAEIAIFAVRALVKGHVFARYPQLAVLALVGGVFGPVASSVCELVQTNGSSFFFAYYLICLAFVSLFPMQVVWVLAVSGALVVSYVGVMLFRARIAFDAVTTTNLLYFADLAVLNVVFNRVIATMFFQERLARVEVRVARDALLGEMEVAQEIQTLLLPHEATLPDHRVRGVMLPADEVGGDYYDVVHTVSGRRFVAIGDVSGHGITSGLTMMMARSSLLGALEADPDATLEQLFVSLNTALRRNLERMRMRLYMTFMLLEELGGGRYRAIGAHLPLLVWRSDERRIEEINLSGVWLGLLDEIPADTADTLELRLGSDDHLLLFTDGIIESMKGDEMFGLDRLKETFGAVADGGPEHAVAAILRALESFGGDRADDMTLLALQYKGREVSVAHDGAAYALA